MSETLKTMTGNPAAGSSSAVSSSSVGNSSSAISSSSSAIGSSWEEIRAELFTPAENAESDLRVALIGELIRARQEKGISQKQLEELSGVKQPVIARMEKGTSSPQLETLLKVLAPLGKTLAIVPLKNE